MNDPGNQTSIVSQQDGERLTRILLAITIPIVALIGITVLAIVIIAVSETKEQSSTLVFNAVLPLFGTWVGTILAYFFAKENFEAANRNTTQLVQTVQRQAAAQEKLKAIPVLQAMVTRIRMVTANPGNTLLSALELLDQNGIKRLPILDKDDRLQGLTYKEDILMYVYRENAAMTENDKKKLTVKDLLDTAKYNRAYAMVAETANLSDAKSEMDKILNCRDCFITKTGASMEPVIGLLTDTDILMRAQI